MLSLTKVNPNICSVGFIFESQVAASMKDKIYNVIVAVTEDEIVSCQCDCQAGSQGCNRGLCVHILPVLLLFSIMLVNDLAQNILVELCHRWDDHLEKKYEKNGNDKMQHLKQSILSLLQY